MAIIINLDVVMAKRKMRSNELARMVGITEQNLSVLKTGKARALRLGTLDALCRTCAAGPAISWNTGGKKTMSNVRVYSVPVPADGLMVGRFSEVHYGDAYAADLPGGCVVTAEQAARAFFMSVPRWVHGLLAVRNLPAKLLGLKTGEGHTMEDMANAPCVSGQAFGFFTVVDRTEEEILMGEEDRHLDFLFSVMVRALPGKAAPSVIMATAVRFNNLLGRLYFIPVKPFHRIIVRAMLKNTVSCLMERGP